MSIARLLFCGTIDKAKVPIFYESRIAKLSLNEAELPRVDSEFEEITEGEEEDR